MDFYIKLIGLKLHLEGDKIKHFLTSFALFFFFLLLSYGAVNSAYLSVACGVGKELFDNYAKKTYFDIEDLVFDIIGVITAFLIVGR